MFHIFLYINQISYLYIKIGFSNYESENGNNDKLKRMKKTKERARERETAAYVA